MLWANYPWNVFLLKALFYNKTQTGLLKQPNYHIWQSLLDVLLFDVCLLLIQCAAVLGCIEQYSDFNPVKMIWLYSEKNMHFM